MNKPRYQVIKTAVKQYISEQTDHISEIQKSQKSLAEGAGKKFEVVIEELRTKIRHNQ